MLLMRRRRLFTMKQDSFLLLLVFIAALLFPTHGQVNEPTNKDPELIQAPKLPGPNLSKSADVTANLNVSLKNQSDNAGAKTSDDSKQVQFILILFFFIFKLYNILYSLSFI